MGWRSEVGDLRENEVLLQKRAINFNLLKYPLPIVGEDWGGVL